MRIFISVDMEGMPGIFSNDQTDPKGDRYDEGRQIMTEISLSVCEELHKNGVEEVLIADSHDGMGNIYYEKMPEYVSLLRGSKRPLSMVYGIERGFDGAIFLGYHAAAGSLHASFDHTYSSTKYSEITVNGKRASEFYINLLVAGRNKVPVILVGGDQVLEEDVKEKAPWVEYVRFKESVSRHSSINPSPEKIKAQLKEKVRTAVKNLKSAKIVDVSPLTVVYRMKHTQDADVAELIPGLERLDGYSLEYKCKDATFAYRMMQVIAHLT